MLKNLSPRKGSHLRSALANVAMTVAVVLMLAITASAYTLVFRDGRRIEIPAEFTLTKMTLTYEVSPGFYRTTQLIFIDVAATERANGEAPGAFFKHRERVENSEPAALPPARLTVTNLDLVPFAERRIAGEKAYERRRIELDLPSIEESRRRQAQEEAATLSFARERAAKQASEESYWRKLAAGLRGEFATVDAQINYLGSRLADSRDFSLATFDSVVTFAPRPFGGFRNRPLRPFGQTRPSFQSGFPLLSPFVFPSQSFYARDEYEREELNSRLDSLLVRRAGLEAQWRELENQARLARVPQVWLLP